MPSRKQQLLDMIAAEPTDPFLRYALALEHRKEGARDESLMLLRQLQEEMPPYIPAFLMAAQQLADDQRIHDARETLRRGIEEARHQSDLHAAGEMAELLSRLGEFGD